VLPTVFTNPGFAQVQCYITHVIYIIFITDLGGNGRRGRPRRKFLDQIREVLEKDQVKSTRNRRACMKNLMKVQEAKGVCKDRSKWKEVISAYLNGKQA
jgi:hypothetical protein